MGSLSSRPSTPQIVYVPTSTNSSASASNNAVTEASSNSAEESATSTQSTDTEALAEEIRTEDLLRRDRGRVGTVQTSFSGLLTSDNKNQAGRKTLLGE